MIRAEVTRRLVVEDSADDDESTFEVYQRVAADMDDGDDRLIAFPESVWLTLDDAEDFANALTLMVAAIRAERPAPVVESDEPDALAGLCMDVNPDEELYCSKPKGHRGGHQAHPAHDLTQPLIVSWSRKAK